MNSFLLRKLLPVFILSGSFLSLSAQQADSTKKEVPEIIVCGDICTEFPEFPGGWDSLTRYIHRNIHFPTIADSTISGMVIVEFTIDTIGNVTNARILKSLHPQFDSIVLAAFGEMPRWKPAINYCGGNSKGRKEAMTIRQPIHFNRKKE